MFGEGPGSEQRQPRIPEASTDFIFAVIAEELGLLGAAALLLAYLLMVGAGLRIAIRCERPFEKLLATGLSLILGVQTFVIVGGVTRIDPPDRHHAAVRVLRRIVADRQLHPAGPAAAHLPRHRDPGAADARRRPRHTSLDGRGMNRQIRLVGLGIIVLFVALFVQLNYLQVVHASGPRTPTRSTDAPSSRSSPPSAATSSPPTGSPWPRRCRPTTSSSGSASTRRAPLFAQITGYFSFTYGADGAERTYDTDLTGSNSPFSCRPA